MSWFLVCPVNDIDPEDVIRFDHAGRTYAIYRSAKGEVFATDGLCTHEQVHLADGLVIDDTIECPKHNGRFNYCSGPPPTRAGLRSAGDLGCPDRGRHDRGGHMTRRLPTVADMRGDKGKVQKTMLRYFSLDEATAAEAAGIDIASVPPELICHPRDREVGPSVFSMTGKAHAEAGTAEDYLRFCGQMLQVGADALYRSASLQTVEYLAREYVPIVGHVGLVPSRATFTGGFQAVGKTANAAIALFHECRRYQEEGAFAVEIEVVPVEVASTISARLDLLLWSMGAGPGCDAQYLFAEDFLGENRGHLPRHAKAYRNFAAEHDRLQAERIAAFSEFRSDVANGAFLEPRQVVTMDPGEHDAFLDGIGG